MCFQLSLLKSQSGSSARDIIYQSFYPDLEVEGKILFYLHSVKSVSCFELSGSVARVDHEK